MRTLTAILTTLAVAAGAGMTAAPAAAADLVRMDGRPIPRLQAMLAAMNVPTLAGTVRVSYGHAFTAYDPDTRTIQVGARRPLTPYLLAHELAHDLELNGLPDAVWDAWAADVGEPLPRTTIADYPGCDPVQEAALSGVCARWLAREHFADWYAGCATRGASFRRQGPYVIGPYGGRLLRTAAASACSRIWRLLAIPPPAQRPCTRIHVVDEHGRDISDCRQGEQ